MGEEGRDDLPLTDSDKNAETAITERDMIRDKTAKSDSDKGEKSDETENTSGNSPHLYRQDVVRCKITGKIGMVMEVAGDTDSESDMSDDDDDDDDDDEDNQEENEAEDVFDNNNSEYGNDEIDDSGDENPDEKKSNGDDGDDDNDGPLSANQVRVLWLNDSEKIHNISDVEVIDRGCLHGDYVASTSNPTGQLGVVVDISINVDLLSLEGSIIRNIPSKKLKRVRDFAEGDYVVLGPWLGRVDAVLDNVTVSFDDGAVCKVLKADPDTLLPVDNNTADDHFPFYPGQRVRSTSSSVFKSSRWLCGSWKANRKAGTVTDVSVGSVLIFWIASAGYGPDCSTAPAEEQSPKNLKLLSCFSHANWQLGDWCLLPIADKQLLSVRDTKIAFGEFDQNELDSRTQEHDCSLHNSVSEVSHVRNASMDVGSSAPHENGDSNSQFSGLSDSIACSSSATTLKDTVPDPRPTHSKKISKIARKRGGKTRKMDQDFEKALLIANTSTRVDVAWQDGTIEHGLVSTSLIPIDNPGDYEFVSEQYVLEKAPDETDDAHDIRRVGVVKSVNAKDRTACVRWLKPVFRAEDPREFGEEEVVSVYELENHPDYDYCYGDVVVRLTPVPLPVNKNPKSVDSDKHPCMNDDGREEEEQSEWKETDAEADKEVSKDFSDLSWVGNITNLRNGDIEVTWADGMVSTVGPQSIYVVGRDEDGDSVGGSDVSGAASWETLIDDETDAVQNSDKEDEIESSAVTTDGDERATVWDDNSETNGALSFPLVALGYVTKLATGIFARGWNSSDQPSKESTGDNESDSQGLMETSDKTVSSNNNTSPKCNEVDEEAVTSCTADLSNRLEAFSNTRLQGTCHGGDACSFKRFDTSLDPVDHYFLGNGHGQIKNGRKWLKKVHQDWNILQNNLPEGIYVRVYEDRMDLLRAVIIGAYGTPYQDGLFFFDFHLPPEYPSVPPSVHYHSGGWRINPNLYEEGKVCLSLLNTWSGKGNEVWDYASSSILQVLVSLQGLVLNSKPYFNEAGYDKQVGTAEGEKNSLSYNENTYLLNVKTMMLLMRKPPKDFEELIKEHFKRRGYYILKACDAYRNGHLIGSLKKDASPSDDRNANSTSVGFKLMLAKILPKLFEALKGVGAECDEFAHLQLYNTDVCSSSTKIGLPVLRTR